MDLIEEFKIVRVEGDDFTEVEDQVVKEFPLTIMVNGAELVTLACSPIYLEELAVGYLFSEGIIEEKANIQSVRLEEDRIFVDLAGLGVSESANQSEGTSNEQRGLPVLKHKVITSGCGRSTIFTDLNGTGLKKVRSEVQFPHAMIYHLANVLNRSSSLFFETGGVHNALLTDLTGGLELFREDVGRHNAVDKLIGHMVLHGLAPDDKMLVTTGRISTEILLKTARRQIPVLVSRSAPTDLAIRLAYRLGITLVGFARGKRMNIYTHAERIC